MSSWIDVNNQLVWISTAVLAYFKTLWFQTPTSQIPAHPVGELTMPTSFSPGVDLVLLKIYFRDLFEGRKDSLWPGRCFPFALRWKMCLWCSALLPLAAALGLKMEQVHRDPAHTVIQERQLLVILHWPVPSGHWSWAGSCSWSSLEPLQQDVMPGIILLLVLHSPKAGGHWGGCSQEQKGSCGWQSSFPRVSVWHKLLTSVLQGL